MGTYSAATPEASNDRCGTGRMAAAGQVEEEACRAMEEVEGGCGETEVGGCNLDDRTTLSKSPLIE